MPFVVPPTTPSYPTPTLCVECIQEASAEQLRVTTRNTPLDPSVFHPAITVKDGNALCFWHAAGKVPPR